jgi:uncharacterized protein YkwD
MIRLLLLLSLACVAVLHGDTAAPPPATAAGRAAAWHRNYTPQTFAALPAAQAPLVRGKFDAALLSAAIHHASNKARASQSLPPLDFSPEAHACALGHSRAMGQQNFYSHKNPHNAAMATAAQRLAAHGIKGGAWAENIAYVHDQKYTYLSLADAVVTMWMKSPSHRKNLLSRKLTRLGCGAWPGTNNRWMLTQNFASPAPAQPPGKQATPSATNR